MGESKSEGLKEMQLPIIRSADGKCFGLEKSDAVVINEEKYIGRFSHLLPANVPDEETKREAKAWLESKCVDIRKLTKA